jgi:hypothetical protein
MTEAKEEKSEGLVMEIFDSIFTKGVNGKVQMVIHAIFLLLQLTLLTLLFLSDYNYHVIFLNIISTSLWATLTWFINEVGKAPLNDVKYFEQKESETANKEK